MDQLRAIKYFVKTAEFGNFTRAAAIFNVPASSLSRRVADLEQSLGATLLKRSTRVVKLTEIGQEYYTQMCDLLLRLEHSNEAVRTYQSLPMGKLKISVMAGFGERILMPLLDRFSELYPDIVLDVHLSDELTLIDRDDVDIAIRGGYAPNERVLAIKLIDNNFIPAASLEYLAHHGTPKHPLDLRAHKGIYYRTPTGRAPWISEIDGQWQDVSPGEVAISNAGTWLIQKAIEGQGIIMLPYWVLKPYFDRGELIELTINPVVGISQTPDLSIFILYEKQRYLVPKIKVAVDFLVEQIKGNY